MQTVTVTRTIDAPLTSVFDWISNAHNYTHSRWVIRERLRTPGADAPYGLGAVRVLIWVVGWFSERVTAYHPPHSFDYHVDRSVPPSRHEHGRVTCTATDGGTHVEWTTTFEVAVPIVGGLLTRYVGRPVMTYAFTTILDRAEQDLA
ncbi:SRPBCC family protein [Gordonia sp. CPCC 206044]|uniref:SRPBCC family protein n=1 Tax=Gordonia sp. CPCC 206044 TaxID=3140793 RepID=UPI003AF3C6F7